MEKKSEELNTKMNKWFEEEGGVCIDEPVRLTT